MLLRLAFNSWDQVPLTHYLYTWLGSVFPSIILPLNDLTWVWVRPGPQIRASSGRCLRFGLCSSTLSVYPRRPQGSGLGVRLIWSV